MASIAVFSVMEEKFSSMMVKKLRLSLRKKLAPKVPPGTALQVTQVVPVTRP